MAVVPLEKPVDPTETLNQMVIQVRQDYGLARLRLGYLLLTIKDTEAWRGRAESFWQYVDDLRLNRSACRGYMAVAQKFFVEMQVSEGIASHLAKCNMSVLERAAQVIDAENTEDVMSILMALHQRDALVALDDVDNSGKPPKQADAVAKVFGKFLDLPDDSRIDFLHKVGATQPKVRRVG